MNIKRILLSSTAMTLLTGISFAEPIIINGAEFEINGEGTVEMINLTLDEEFEGKYVIPSEITVSGVTYKVTSIGERAISNKPFTECEIPSTVTNISDAAFFQNEWLKSIVIPNSVTTLGTEAFALCSGMTSATIGSGVTEMGITPFAACYNLKTVSVDEDNKTFCSVGGVVCNKQKTELIFCPGGAVNVDIPESVVAIGQRAFMTCMFLPEIKLPDGLETIGDRAFYGCRALKEIEIPATVKHLEETTFSNCTSLTKITLPETDEIPAGFLALTNSLTEITIPKSVKRIGESAFQGSGLTSIVLPSVEETGPYAFAECNNLTEVTLSPSTKTIGASSFTMSPVTTIYSPATVPPVIEINEDSDYFTFDDSTLSDATVYVPETSVADYRNAAGWDRFANIRGKDFGASKTISVEQATRQICVVNGYILVMGAPCMVTIRTLAGVTVHSGFSTQIPQLPSGFYIVDTEGERAKVVL